MDLTKDDVKDLVCERIEQHAETITSISDYILKNPETGYCEYNTSRYVARQLRELGLRCQEGLARTGVKARLKGNTSGPTIAILGELDALIVPDNPFAADDTGAAHACGHNAQAASMIGAAIGLSRVTEVLGGDVVFFGVPAEECIELEWRLELRARGEIEFPVGKAELVRLGQFDDIDMAMLTHTQVGDGTLASVGDSHNGALVKTAVFTGRAAHAGSFPWLGVNALKAATLALTAIDAQRETFQESETIRVHPIVTEGGTAVSSVPSGARVEMLIRARSIEGMRMTAAAVDRALRAGALAVGAEVKITTTAAYLPHHQDPNLIELMRANCVATVGAECMGSPWHRTGSTDMGDLSQFMPVVHPRTGGGHGTTHSADYYVEDHYLAAVNPAKFMAMTVVDLLGNDSKEARRVLHQHETSMTRSQYLQTRRSLDREDVYAEDDPRLPPADVT